MPPRDIESRARLLVGAYTHLRATPNLEDEIAKGMGGTLPIELQQWVCADTSVEVAKWIAGEEIRGCPWDTGDPHPLRRSLARYWHECLETLLFGYREHIPTIHPGPRLVDEYLSDDWVVEPRITTPRRRV